MKRDPDLIRELLMRMEAHEHYQFTSVMTDSSSVDAEREHGHLLLLADQGFAEMGNHSFRLTNQGHDFLEATRDENRWAKAKNVTKSAGLMTLETLFKVCGEMGAEAIKQKLGLS